MEFKQRSALIIGGSMAGLFCGTLLQRAGWDVRIYERAGEELSSRGAGITTHDQLYDAIRLAGIPLRPEMGVTSRGRRVFAADGSLLAACELPQLMTSWGFIYRFLRSQFAGSAYRNGMALASFEQHERGVTACFENGEQASAAWLIGADGARSTVRSVIAPGTVARYCGYLGWRGLAEEAALPTAVLAELCDHFALNPAEHGHLLGYMVAGPNDDLRPGHRWYNWVWYRRADEASLREHLTGLDGQYYPHGIPHDQIRPSLGQRLQEQASRELAPCLRTVIRSTSTPFLQAIMEVGSPRMRMGRVALIGDAAFTARPHVGLGVSKAAGDGTSLAAALIAVDQAQALQRWEAARLRFGRSALRWGQEMGSYIETPRADPVQRAQAAFHRRADVLMVQTASNTPEHYLGVAD